MKRWVLLGATLLALTGCTSSTLDASDYYALVHKTKGLAVMSNGDIDTIGHKICAAFDDDSNTYADVLGAFSGVYSAEDAGTLIALSVRQYCPSNLGKIHA